MSSEQSSINSQTVEQTKQQIRGLVSEIAQLSKTDLAPAEYYAAFLDRVVQALAAVGGAVWVLGENRKPELSYQINLSETLLDPASDDAVRHMKLLGQTVQGVEPRLIPPLSSGGDEVSGANPTRYLLVLAPLRSDTQMEGLVEIFQRPDSQPATQRGYLRFLIQMCELASEWLKSRKLRHFSDRHSLWAQADEFSRLVHESLDVRETCYTIVNEGRRLIGCDRVSVAIQRGKACKVEAVSGQDSIENRSNIIAALGRLATRVVATGEPLWFDGRHEDLPPQLEEAVDQYVDESYAKSVFVLPLRKPRTQEEHDPRRIEEVQERMDDVPVVGALIVEQIESELPRALIEPRMDLVYEHSTRALSNALDHEGVFLMPLWKAIGKSSFLIQARMLPKTLLVAGLVLATIIGLLVIRKDFTLESRGVLQPVVRRDVFFDGAGTVTSIKVKDGDWVHQGDVLVELENHELEQEFQRTLGEGQETLKRLLALRKQMIQGGLKQSEETQISGEIMSLEQRQRTLKDQLDLIQHKRDRLVVRSPIDGQVLLPWDAEQSLLHRPVVVGQVVMTVAQPDGQWELKLDMPERRMGHIAKAWKEYGPDLEASYILATEPGTRHYGHVKSVRSTVEVAERDKGPTVEILVDIDEKDLSDPQTGVRPRPGATVTSKVKCGRASVAYTLFHEVIEWIQAHLLF